MVIILQFDQAYQKWAHLLLESLRTHHPETRVVLSTVGLTEPEQKAFYAYHHIVVENEDDGENKYQLPSTIPDKSTRMACRKAYVMQDIMTRYSESAYLLLDADLYIRRPIQEILQVEQAYDIGLLKKEKEGEITHYKHLNSSMVWVNKNAKSFIDDWIFEMESKTDRNGLKQWAWFWDQSSLWAAHEKNEAYQIKYVSVRDYCCADFRDSAPIWSANLSAQSKDIIYTYFIKEMKGDWNKNWVQDAVDCYQKEALDLACIFIYKAIQAQPNNIKHHEFFACLLIALNQIETARNVLNRIDAEFKREGPCQIRALLENKEAKGENQ